MRILTAVSILGLLSACTTELPEPRPVLVDSVAEAGETHISVLSVEAWDTARSALNVRFNLDAKTALSEAIPRTSTYEERLLDIFAANLKVGLPQTSVSSSSNTDAQGVTTRTRSETGRDGTLPGDDVIPSPGDRDVNQLPGLESEQREQVLAQNDPLLKYQTARTIQQYVTVLDRVIENAPQIDDYEAFLVTMQVTSFPYSKHQPYDIYLDISFFPKEERDEKNPMAAPVIYPVLITDNLEGQSVSRSAELVRQIGLAANVLSSGLAGSLGLSSFNARAGAVFGTDLTSTFTVGKSSENSMTVVLGAARNPVSDYAMIRRTHNVSVLMLLPKEILTRKGTRRAVDMLTTTELRRPDRKSVPMQLRTPHSSGFDTAMALAHERGIAGEVSDKELEALINEAWEHQVAGDYLAFKQFADGKGYANAPLLYHVVGDVYGKSPNFKTTAIPLPRKSPRPKPAPFCVDPGSAGAFDDPKNGEMRVVLTGASGRKPGDLTATLHLKVGQITYPFVASQIAMSDGKLVMVFPSAARAGLDNVSADGGSLSLGTSAKTCEQVKQSSASQIVYTVAPKAQANTDQASAKPASATISASGSGGLDIALNAAATKP